MSTTGSRSGLPWRLRAMVLWVAVGVAWVVASFLPWTSRGLLSSSSTQDGVRLIRSGAFSAVAPAWLAWFLLAPTASGVALLATATRHGAAMTVLRVLLVVAVAVVFAASWSALADGALDRLGPGGWLTAAGMAVALVALADQWSHARRTTTEQGTTT